MTVAPYVRYKDTIFKTSNWSLSKSVLAVKFELAFNHPVHVPETLFVLLMSTRTSYHAGGMKVRSEVPVIEAYSKLVLHNAVDLHTGDTLQIQAELAFPQGIPGVENANWLDLYDEPAGMLP